MASDDRRQDLRRIDDVRQLLRFCRAYGQAVPSRLVGRLEELAIHDGGRRPIGDLLDALDAIERPALAELAKDRRRRARRWINPSVIEEPDTEYYG